MTPDDVVKAWVVEVVLGDGLVTYSELARRLGVKRGWLDGLVNAKGVEYKPCVVRRTMAYRLSDVLRELERDPGQQRRWRMGARAAWPGG
jgi:hypothetical protein